MFRTFKDFIEEGNDASVLKDLRNLFKNDYKFIEMLKKANNDKDIVKIVEYISDKYSIELEKIMKKYNLSSVDLAKYILELKGEKK